MKRFFTLLLSTFLIIAATASIFAQDNMEGRNEYSRETEEAIEVKAERANSFELFWPVVAGRTVDDSLFFLKKIKESIRGMFVFGAPRKAEYEMSLAIKRLLEAEKLIDEGKDEKAVESISLALNKLNFVKENWVKARNANSERVNEMGSIINKVENLNKLLPYYLKNSKGSLREKFGEVDFVLSDLRENLQ